MKHRFSITVFFLLIAAFAFAIQIKEGSGGYILGGNASDKLAFFGTTPVVQPSGSSQAALTDSTTGTASSTLAAGVGTTTVSIPLDLAAITGDGDVLTTYTPGYAFKILSVDVAVTDPATTAAKATTLNLEIGTTNVTGGAVALTSANATPLGAVVAGSAVTATNTGTASDTISVESASTTAFAEGNAVLLIKLQNMDTANAAASQAAQANALRSALVDLGLIAGS